MASRTSSPKVDALIIGGGIIGLAIAYYLGKRNFCNVELIERESELTVHASGHNAGGLSGIHVSQRRELWPLIGESQKLYRELSESSGFEFDFARRGTIVPGTANEETEFEETARKYGDENEGIQLRFLNKQELQRKEPYISTDRFSCALYYPLDAQGNSKKLGECLAKSCLQKGMKITTASGVTGFEISRGRVVKVLTSDGRTLTPDVVVVAAGPWSREVSAALGVELPVSPVKGHLISVDTGGLKLVNSFISGSMYYVLQNSASAVVIGGGEDSSGFDTQIDPVRIDEAWADAISMVPKLDVMKESVVSSTACLRPHASDGLPILGKSKRLDNVFFASGHFRNGFGLAPVTGKLISQLIVDGTSEIDLSAFSPDRFLSNS